MMRPGKGTKTGTVWEIADAISTQFGRPARRGEVVEAAVERGINSNTANTQYGHWKRSTYPELSGVRIAPSGEDAPFGVASEEQPDWTTLLKNGFHYGSDWVLSEDGGPLLDRKAPAESGVYVIVLDDCVVYVGVTARTLNNRMDDYRRGHARQRTSARIHSLIISALQEGHKVRVLFAVPGSTEWNGLPVDISAGLEKGLIRKFRPAWNKQGL